MLKSEELINKVKSYNKFLNPETLSKAYEFALKAHVKQKRDEGAPYIIHPVAVADILSDLKLDSATIATGLLHDTIEDTHATYNTIKEDQNIPKLTSTINMIILLQTNKYNETIRHTKSTLKLQYKPLRPVIPCPTSLTGSKSYDLT